MRLQMFVREKRSDGTVVIAINKITRGVRKGLSILGEIPVQVSAIVPLSHAGPFS
jgi:hypothetical protein